MEITIQDMIAQSSTTSDELEVLVLENCGERDYPIQLHLELKYPD